MIKVDYGVANAARFNEVIANAKAAIGDLTIPLTLIAKDWYRGNRAMFLLKGPGQWTDLADGTNHGRTNYKAAKLRKWGFVYPILKASGALESSLTNPTDANTISQIINKDTLILGTRLPYAAALNFGYAARNLPPRPFMAIRPESGNARDETQGQMERWVGYIAAHVANVLQAAAEKNA